MKLLIAVICQIRLIRHLALMFPVNESHTNTVIDAVYEQSRTLKETSTADPCVQNARNARKVEIANC